MNQRIKIIKIGGNIVDDRQRLEAFLADFARIPEKKILIHGGGKEATRLSAALGIETTMIEGRRVTDAATLDVVTMVYAGLVNKRLVALLQALECDAIGLSGSDGNVIRASRRHATPIDFGFVGDISVEGVNTEFINTLISTDLTPVFCAITHDGHGTLLNCNADSVASAIAMAMSRVADVDLCFCFDKPGVLADINDPASLITDITPKLYKQLRADGTVSSGMIPKIDNAFKAIDYGVKSVNLISAENLLTLKGTKITAG